MRRTKNLPVAGEAFGASARTEGLDLAAPATGPLAGPCGFNLAAFHAKPRVRGVDEGPHSRGARNAQAFGVGKWGGCGWLQAKATLGPIEARLRRHGRNIGLCR